MKGNSDKLFSPGSISSCFMTTCLAFAKKLHFEISHFACESIGQFKIVENKYKFTRIRLYSMISILPGIFRENALAALEKTHKYYLIANPINVDLFYYSEIDVVSLNELYGIYDTA